MGKNVVVIGTQWGAEGKGKVVAWLTEHAQGVVRFELEGIPALISKDAPEQLPPEPSPPPPVPMPSPPIPFPAPLPMPKKRGRPPKVRPLDSGTVSVDTSTIDEGDEWRPEEA